MSLVVLEQLDRLRRRQGKWYDRLGFGPEITPSRVIHSEPGVRVLGYGPEGGEKRPALLLVPAPIKASYIWDLEPAVSVVRHAMAKGFRVYLVDWESPGKAQQDFGLAAYADRLLLGCIEAIEKADGPPRVFVAGHSLGGTLVALFASIHPQRLQGLVLLEAPLRFGNQSGAFAPLVGSLPRIDYVTKGVPVVPGSLLNTASAAAAPDVFLSERWLDSWLSSSDPEAARRHQRVERWTLDEAPLARRLFDETVELLYRRDCFLRGELVLDGQLVHPEAVTAPVLSVVNSRNRVVPPDSILPFHDLISSNEREILFYTGDIGVALQHVGVLVGPSAHRNLWPRIFAWLQKLG